MKFLPSKVDRAAFGKIANEYDLVYFGRVDPQNDIDYDQVKGITANISVVDENYTTGDVYDYSVAFLQRTRKIHKLKNGQELAATRWTSVKGSVQKIANKSRVTETTERKRTILQVNLKHASLPHIFICGRARLSEYATLIQTAERWQEIADQNLPPGQQTEFARSFATFVVMTNVAWLPYILTAETQSMLMTHFTQFDYEIFGDKLLIYSVKENISVEVLDHMLRIGLWWARSLDATCAQTATQSQTTQQSHSQ